MSDIKINTWLLKHFQIHTTLQDVVVDPRLINSSFKKLFSAESLEKFLDSRSTGTT